MGTPSSTDGRSIKESLTAFKANHKSPRCVTAKLCCRRQQNIKQSLDGKYVSLQARNVNSFFSWRTTACKISQKSCLQWNTAQFGLFACL